MTPLYAGLVVWLVTLVLVEGFVFEWYREGIRKFYQQAYIKGRSGFTLSALQKWAYLSTCHLCTGVWVGWAVAAIVGGPWHWLLSGLLYKAIGHVILEVTATIKALGQHLERR